jgi:hypothetical protein
VQGTAAAMATHVVMALHDNMGPISGNISLVHSSRSRTRDTLVRREKGGANIEREGSLAMAAKVERAPQRSHFEELTSVEVESMGAPSSTCHGSVGARWM